MYHFGWIFVICVNEQHKKTPNIQGLNSEVTKIANYALLPDE